MAHVQQAQQAGESDERQDDQGRHLATVTFLLCEENGALLATIRRALKLYGSPSRWERLMLTGMRQDWSWDRSAKAYVDVYRNALG